MGNKPRTLLDEGVNKFYRGAKRSIPIGWLSALSQSRTPLPFASRTWAAIGDQKNLTFSDR